MSAELNLAVVFTLAAIALYDLWLAGARLPTISEAYQALFSTKVDLAILVGVTVGICLLPIWPALRVIMGVAAGHVFWANKERYQP